MDSMLLSTILFKEYRYNKRDEQPYLIMIFQDLLKVVFLKHNFSLPI